MLLEYSASVIGKHLISHPERDGPYRNRILSDRLWMNTKGDVQLGEDNGTNRSM